MGEDVPSEETQRRKSPPWLKTWWSKLVGVGAVIGFFLGVFTDAFGFAEIVSPLFRSGAAESPVPVETLGPVAAERPAATYTGGWGPKRDTFTVERPANYAVLNSITNFGTHGDERNFVQARLEAHGDASYADIVRADIGDEIVIYAWVANDAADNLAGNAATIHGLTATLYVYDGGTDNSIAIILEGKNATAVWDGASIITQADARLAYIVGTGRFFTNHAENGLVLPDSFGEREPVAIGQAALDGELPVGYDAGGIYQGSGYLTFRLRVLASE